MDISCPSSYSQVLDETIWNNKLVCINDRPLYRIKVINEGILKIGDILTSDYKLKSYELMKIVGLTNAEYFLLMGICNAIPKDWMNLLKLQSNLPRNSSSSNNLGSTDPSQRASLPASSRQIYWNLVGKMRKKPTAESKYEDLFSMHGLQWEQVYLLPRRATLDSKTRKFQYKLLHRIIYTNKSLSKMGLVPPPMCSFCEKLEESLQHLFIYCDTSKNIFWFSVIEWLKEHSFGVNHLSA